MLVRIQHITKGTYSFWAPADQVPRILDEYAELEWYAYKPKAVRRERRPSD